MFIIKKNTQPTVDKSKLKGDEKSNHFNNDNIYRSHALNRRDRQTIVSIELELNKKKKNVHVYISQIISEITC